MNFPDKISFTITNVCNLRCKMCGQWSEEGYIQNKKERLKNQLSLADWKRVVDEIASHNVTSVLIRGGEPFLFPGIIELLEYIHNKGMYISIDSNGTLLKQYAEDILRIGNMHITFSVDGTEDIHDQVRGLKGCFGKIEEGLNLLNELEKTSNNKISRSICFTISPYSYKALGEMANIARRLSIQSIVVVPYYYIPDKIGEIYEKELEYLNCNAFTWKGFHHDESGIDFDEFLKGYRKYKESLGDIDEYPYLPLGEEDFKTWFNDAVTPVYSVPCSNVERLIDIQPDGEANFCVDFPDYKFGNIKDHTIEELWNNEKAEKFRQYRRKNPLAVCYRCGAKYMSEDRDEYGNILPLAASED